MLTINSPKALVQLNADFVVKGNYNGTFRKKGPLYRSETSEEN